MNEFDRFIRQVKDKSGLSYWLFDGQWQRVDQFTILLDLAGQAKAGLACYPNGEILCKFGKITHLPEGVTFLIEPRLNSHPMRYEKNRVRNGAGGALIQHASSKSQSGDPRYYYATRVTNQGSSRIRVIKFGPFDVGIFGVKRDPIKGYYTGEQFQNWYNVEDPAGWIQPGQTVFDPDNYGSGSGVWAYFFEDETGDCFIATAPLTNA
jgi:hypothetical protein